jgi:hypothetical protein
MTELSDRSIEFLKQRADQAIDDLEVMDMPHLSLKEVYHYLIALAKDSIKLHQELIAQDSKIRDKMPAKDLVSLELIWNNIQLSHDIIKQEMSNINAYREVIKHG